MGCGALADREAVLGALEQIEAATDALATLSMDGFTPAELLGLLGRREILARRQPTVDHRIYHRLRTECTPTSLGATSLTTVLTTGLRISAAEARRRLEDAQALGPRTALTGEPLAPQLPSLAQAQAQAHGAIGTEHVEIVRWFFARLPAHVDYQARERAEADLARHARTLGPEGLRKVTEKLLTLLDHDGELTDIDRARRRGVTIGRQGTDGMSPISGYLDPQARATWDAVLAKLAAPGMCNPADCVPQVDAAPSAEQVQSDTRTQVQRNHDAFTAAGRALLASGTLGTLNGLPATIIVSTTLKELQSGCGQGLTAGGTLLPISDVLQLASHAFHYLVLFDGHGIPLHLGRSRRTASPGQRIVLHAKDRGCTAPGCTASGYRSQVHHATADWKHGGRTDIDDLTFACGPCNRLVENSGWTTRKRPDGITEWIPPPELDSGQPRTNNHHHPERLLAPNNDDDDP
jgi:Domain of unknown function (DUF222)/HNH endonuclease